MSSNNNNNNDNKSPKPASVKIVVVKKKKKNQNVMARKKQPPSRLVVRKGLPASKLPIVVAAVHHDEQEEDGKKKHRRSSSSNEDKNDDDVEFFSNLACDTLLVFQSLQSSVDSRLEIPSSTSNDGTESNNIHAILECQIHEAFLLSSSRKGGSSTSVKQELDHLFQTNQLRRLMSSSSHSAQSHVLTALITTQDYIHAARHAVIVVDDSDNNNNTSLLDWFLDHLQVWTKSYISKNDIQEAWDVNPPIACRSVTTASDYIRWLQDRQLLLVASTDHTQYQLWLPTWGQFVLPAFYKAKTDALTFLKQSQYRERSVVSLIRRLTHSPIAVNGVLIPWLVSEGFVQRVERPSGTFLQLPS